MKVLHINPYSGISGNMFIGACVDLGVDLRGFFAGVGPLGLTDSDFILQKVKKRGLEATYFNLKEEEHMPGKRDHTHRSLLEVEEFFEESLFSPQVLDKAREIYRLLAVAEGKAHGVALEQVHFHEVGALDSVVDVLGAAYCMEALQVEEVRSSAVNPGTGCVSIAHGIYPVPAPATAYILETKKIPLGGTHIQGELTTPTGAAILATMVDRFQNMGGRLLATGYGAGMKDLETANVLPLYLLEEENPKDSPVYYSFTVDDMTGEELGYFMEQSFALGALDCTFRPIYMKKNRPGTEVSLLVEEEKKEEFLHFIFSRTSTLGVKKIPMERIEMKRFFISKEVEGLTVREKHGVYKKIEKTSYEYEDLKKIAEQEGISLREAERRAEHG